MKLLFLDTETTGTDPKKHGVIQIAGIVEIDGDIKEEFNFKCQPFPGQLISQDALKINGITLEQIKTFPMPGDTYKELETIFSKHIDRYDKTDKFYLVGQNIRFDYDMLTEFFMRNSNPYLYGYISYHLIDLIAITAMFTLAGKLKTANMKLMSIAEAMGIKFNAHDAMEDIKVCHEIFHRYKNIISKGENL